MITRVCLTVCITARTGRCYWTPRTSRCSSRTTSSFPSSIRNGTHHRQRDGRTDRQTDRQYARDVWAGLIARRSFPRDAFLPLGNFERTNCLRLCFSITPGLWVTRLRTIHHQTNRGRNVSLGKLIWSCLMNYYYSYLLLDVVELM